VHHLIAELYDGVDWVLVEGFKQSDLLKIEVWRSPGAGSAAHPALYAEDAFIVAVATDVPDALPEATLRPVLDLNDAPSIAAWLVDNGGRFHYTPEHHL
jgi:molybdopterin-guanine dinucleotide biosynthesis protein B